MWTSAISRWKRASPRSTFLAGRTKKKYIIETTGGGVAIFDFDNDGLPDIFLVNGTTLEGRDKATSHLYRNLGNLQV